MSIREFGQLPIDKRDGHVWLNGVCIYILFLANAFFGSCICFTIFY